MKFKNRVDFLKLMELVDKLPEDCLGEMIESMADDIRYHLHCLKLFDKCVYCNKDYQLGKKEKEKQIKLL